jgi:hypothetical protein
MKQPVWILNSSLLILFFMSQLLLFMLQRAVPRRVSISLGTMVVEQEQAVVPVDITKIYENDLFGTYEVPVVVTKSIVDDVVAAMPKPPKILIPEVPVEKTPTFFAPLDVILKGVIFVKDDPSSCIAIVQLKKTKEERNYQVGDLIEDAQILKILSNRIIIVRSNGQQETLYLREEDAISDFNTEVKAAPKAIIENVSGDKYTLNIDEFTKRIHNLGEFINVLDLTTVYKQGKSFGCRIGKIDKDSLGAILGFVIDDIVVKIDDYFVDDLDNRIKLYDHIMQKHAGDTIEVALYRGHNLLTFIYGLVDNVSKSVVFTSKQTHQKLIEELSKHEADSLAQSMSTKKDVADNTVVIQNISRDHVDSFVDDSGLEDFINEDENPFQLNLDETLELNDVSGVKTGSPLSQIINNQNNSSNDISSLNSETLNELNMHKQRLIQEREKMMPTLQDMKFKDRNNMMKQSSKNVIFNGMQQ